jgi:hypothetical protein
MTGFYLMIFGFLVIIVGFVFLFFKNLFKIGIVFMILSLISIVFGFKSCEDHPMFRQSKVEEIEEIESIKREKIEWINHGKKLSKSKANFLFIKKIKEIQNNIVGDSLEIYVECINKFKSKIKLFEEKLIFDLNDLSMKNHPFKVFDFGELYHLKNHNKWVNETKIAVPVTNEVTFISGIISNQNGCIIYEGFLNIPKRTIYWSNFSTSEIIKINWIKYKPSFQLEEKDKFSQIIQANKSLRVDYIYWDFQQKSNFMTKSYAFRKDLINNQVKFQNQLIPLYKVSKFKENGDIDLRETYTYKL